jgi:hypothetical protein
MVDIDGLPQQLRRQARSRRCRSSDGDEQIKAAKAVPTFVATDSGACRGRVLQAESCRCAYGGSDSIWVERRHSPSNFWRLARS